MKWESFKEFDIFYLFGVKDPTLAKTLVRITSLFQEDLSNAAMFSVERYGSVTRVYIISTEDLTIPEDFQRWMIDNYPGKEVKEIKGSDHTPMFSKPQELCQCPSDIAATYSWVLIHYKWVAFVGIMSSYSHCNCSAAASS